MMGLLGDVQCVDLTLGWSGEVKVTIRITKGTLELIIEGVSWSTWELTKKYLEVVVEQFKILEK